MQKKEQKGITLIALIITIIVILILVAVTVRTTVNSGLFNHAKDATQKWSDAQNAEANINIDEYVDEINSQKFLKVSAGEYHSMALDVDGNIWTWGLNGAGNLGDGTKDDKLIPQKLMNLGTTFKEISAGCCSIAIDKDGNLWTWGWNKFGELGNGTTENRPIPKKLTDLDTTFKKVSAGKYNHSIALDIDGNIWTCGYNGNGELGDGTTNNKSTFQKLTGLGTTFKEISAGDCYSMALDIDGNIWSWGFNGNGELGDGSKDSKSTPQKLTGLGTTFKEISAGFQHTLALDIDGNIWAWGCNGEGELGNGNSSEENTLTPQKLTGLGTTFKEISAGDFYSVALDIDGNIWSWGYNCRGNLGNGTEDDNPIPQKLTGLGTTFKEIPTGDMFSLALDIDGNIWSWGYNEDGELGNGNTEDNPTPQKLKIKK